MRAVVASLSVAALFAVPASAGAAIGFRTMPFDFGGSPANGIAAGDFNGDGRLDLAGATKGNAVIFLGDGGGSMGGARPSPEPAARTDSDVAATDFDRDGKLDLAVSNAAAGSVSVLLGNGDGTLRAPSSFSTSGNNPTTLGVGDLNGDSNPDIAVANTDSDKVATFLGDGHGGFGPAQLTDTFGNRPTGIALGDFNVDNKLDVVVVNSASQTLTMLRGKGDGTFVPPSQDPRPGLPPNASQVSVPNVAQTTGGPDPVVSVGDPHNEVDVFNDDDQANAAVHQTSATGVGGANPYGLAGADFDADGKVDIAVANQTSKNVSVLLGDGAGGLTGAPGSPYPAGDPSPAGLAVGDFNNDLQPDIAVAGAVLLNTNVGGVTLDPSAIDFGAQPFGAVTPNRNVTVRNTGTGFVSIVGVGGTGDLGADFPITGGTCRIGLILNVGDTCEVTAAFSPSNYGPRSAQLVVFDSAPGSPHRADLKGLGPTSPNANPDTAAPIVDALRADPPSFAVSRQPTAEVARAKKKKRKKASAKGTTFRFTVSEASRVQLAIRLRLNGRRKGSRCVKPSRKLRKARKCFRLQTIGALRRSATAGANAVPFSGRIGTKKLKPGRYQVDVAATDDAGNKSAERSAVFTVKRR